MSEKKIETKTIKTAEPIEDQTSFPEVKQYPEVPAPAPQVPLAEPINQQAEDSARLAEAGKQLLNSLTDIDRVSLEKFEDFKTEVIKAFRHLGLDTRRHFTE